jgi:IS1 family transposase/transposase-like protein
MNCPRCSCSDKIVKNGLTSYKIQKYLCKECKRQFLSRDTLVYKKASDIDSRNQQIIRLLERGNGVRDIEYIMNINRNTVLNIISKLSLKITPRHKIYKSIQVDELWSFVGNKKNKKWTIYAYAPDSKEILATVTGRRDAATVQKLYNALKQLDVQIQEYCTDNWDSFAKVFVKENHKIGKEYTKHIEGVNCLFRHRISRLVRRTCCFSKKLQHHANAIGLIIAGINLGSAWAT